MSKAAEYEVTTGMSPQQKAVVAIQHAAEDEAASVRKTAENEAATV